MILPQHAPGQSSIHLCQEHSSSATNKGRCQNTEQKRENSWISLLLAQGSNLLSVCFPPGSKGGDQGLRIAFLVVLLKLVAAMQRKTLPEELVCLPLLALTQD